MSNSKGFGQIIKTANKASKKTAPVRKALGFKPNEETKKFISKEMTEKVKTKPRTKNIGLVLLLCPTDPPKIIGKGNKIQGAMIVSIPAIKAKNI